MKIILSLLVMLCQVQPVAAEKSSGLLAGVTWQSLLVSMACSLIAAGIAYSLALKTASKKIKEHAYHQSLYNTKENSPTNNKKPSDKESTQQLLDIKNDIKNIMIRVNDQEALINKFSTRIETPYTPPPPTMGPIEETQPSPDVKIEYFFLSTPNANGSFNESSATATYKEGASIYRFTKESFNKATFRLDDREASVRLAVQYPDKNIDPVCDALNAYNAKATRIVTREPGAVELLGDKWVLKQKAKISYEG